MTLPLTNAALVEIAGPGPLDEYGDPTGTVARWTGSVGGYLKRTSRKVVSGGQQVDVITDVFIARDTVGMPLDVLAGANWDADTVLINDQRTPTAVTRRFTVSGLEHRQTGSIADSVRLQLGNEQDG